MSIFFWKRKGDSTSPENEYSVAASRANPVPVAPYLDDEDEQEHLPVSIKDLWLPPVAGQLVTRMYKVPGIGTGSVYAAGEAFGTGITLHGLFRAEKCSGTIVEVLFYDLDDEGAIMEMPLFTESFTTTADNSAFAPSDDDLLKCVGVIQIGDFHNWSSNQMGQASRSEVPRWIQATSPNLYTQLTTLGTPTIAAGAEPWIKISAIPD